MVSFPQVIIIIIIIIIIITISKSLRQYPSSIPEKHEIRQLQKTAILATAHKLREVSVQKYKTYFTGEITLHVAHVVNTEQLVHYIP